MGDEDRDDDTQQHPTTYSSFPNFRPDAAIAPEVTVSAFDFSAPDANIGGGSALAPRQLPGNGGAPTSHSDPTLDEFRGSMKELARNAVERRELSVYKSTPRILIYGRSESYRAMAQLGDGDAAGGFQRPPPVVEFNYNYNAKTADATAATWRRPGDGQVAGIRDRIVTTSTSDHTISSSNSVNVVPRSRQIGQDREVSTSYTDSLHEIFQQAAAHTNQQKRLTILAEESTSRPASAFYLREPEPLCQEQDEDQVPIAEEEDDEPITVITGNQRPPTVEITDEAHEMNALGDNPGHFMSMEFIQMNSQELAYESKPKTAKVIGKYVLGDMIGEGAYGKVKEGFCIENLKRVAVKIMKQSKLKKIANGEQNVKREIKLLRRLHHRNVVQLMDVIYKEEKHKIYVVLEFCAGTLDSVLKTAPAGKIPHSQAQRYFKQIVEGLQYVHAHYVVHRDLKAENLLLTIDETIKITDFGVAEELPRYRNEDEFTSSAGSPAFQPPEAAGGSASFSGIKADIWAIGVILYNMISGIYPFDGENLFVLLENISKGEYVLPAEAEDPIFQSLLTGILDKDPRTRLSLHAIANHGWLKAELPRDPHEVPIIAFVDPEAILSPPVPTSHRPSPSASPIPHGDDDEAIDGEDLTAHSPNSKSPTRAPSSMEEDADETLFRIAPAGHISNPNFAHDSTLPVFLEMMFEDLPHISRRTSIADRMRALQTKHVSFPERLMNRLRTPSSSRPETCEKDSLGNLKVDSKHDKSHKRNPSNASSISRSRPMTPFFSRNEGDRCKVQ